MKRNGFTLIELLAVIVILAIIAVIAVPIVINIIEDSKKNATLRSAEMYMHAVELSIANRVMHHGAIPNKAYPIMSNGNICLENYQKTEESETCNGLAVDVKNNEKVLEVEVNGEAPKSGTIIIENGQIVNELSINKYLEAVKQAIKNLSVEEYAIMNNGNLCTGTLESDTCTGDILSIEVNIAKPNSGIITKTGDNVTIKEESKDRTKLEIGTQTIIQNSEGKITYTACKLTIDEDKDEIADVGDKITCGSESFYVIKNENEEITMLAEFNLDIGNTFKAESWGIEPISNPTGMQNKNAKGGSITGEIDAYGVVAFSSDVYWFSGEQYIIDSNYLEQGKKYPYVYGDHKDANGNQQNLIYPYVQSYVKALEKIGVIVKDSRLISYEELESLGCSNTYNSQCLYSWVKTSSYWTGSVTADSEGIVWEIESSYMINGTGNGNYFSMGIRPVIIMESFNLG